MNGKPPDSAEQLDRALQRSSEEAERTSNAPDKATESGIERARRDRFEAVTAGIKADTRGRTVYAKLTFRLIVWWLVGTFLILLFQGFLSQAGTEYILSNGSIFKVHFELSQPVLLMFLGTSTGTVVGLFATVMLYLFKAKGAEDEIESDEPEQAEEQTDTD